MSNDVNSADDNIDNHTADETGAAEEVSGVSQDKPLYVISVAAELVDMHPQTLRLYERKGLIEPSRSSGKTRLYSQRDITHLREIRRLTQELGVNLAGVEEIIRLRRELDALQGAYGRAHRRVVLGVEREDADLPGKRGAGSARRR